MKRRLQIEDGRFGIDTETIGAGEQAVVVLHGGPGVGSDYLRRFEELASGDRRIVFYDQLGGGTSDWPGETYEWTVQRFVDELEEVRTQLGLGSMHLIGQSWGGCLALQYALDHPAHVQSLVLSNTGSSIPLAYSEMHRLRRELGPAAFAAMLKHEAAGTLDDPEYRALVHELEIRHLRRSTPWTHERASAEWQALVAEHDFETVGPAYEAMWGPHEYLCTGELLTFDVTARLPEIAVPALIVAGLHDEATVEGHQVLADGIADNEFVIFGNSSHLILWEKEAEAYLAVIRDFLDRRR